MTYLELINSVLVRLREPVANSGNYASDPFFLMIGACVNDAKDAVEDAWDWTALRGAEAHVLGAGEYIMRLDNSANTNYRVRSIMDLATGRFLEQTTPNDMEYIYANNQSSPVGNGTPTKWAYTSDYWNPNDETDVQNGAVRIQFNCPVENNTDYRIIRVKHQDQLVSPDSRLRIPDLPVYTLATAFASRERGEIGGAPVNELFAIAKHHLSDAIAKDANKYPEEFTWYVPRAEYQGTLGN